MYIRVFVGMLLLSVFSSLAVAQQQHTDNIFTRFAKWRISMVEDGMDSGYVMAPKHKWMGELSATALDVNMRLTVPYLLNHKSVGIDLKSGYSLSALVGAYYLGWGLGMSKGLLNSDDFDFTFTSYANAMGFDLKYTTRSDVPVSFALPDKSSLVFPSYLDEARRFASNSAELTTLNINYYYAFNNTRFAYSAPLGQSTIQLRSAGSPFLGVSYCGSHVDLNSSDAAVALLADQLEFHTHRLSMGLGYGYNWVFGSHGDLLLHASAMPMVQIPVYRSVKMSSLASGGIGCWTDEMQSLYAFQKNRLLRYADTMKLSLMALLRLAAYWNISESVVVGTTYLGWWYSSFSKSDVQSDAFDSHLYCYFGYRF
ncbi:MAG: DUF4421 family protein [Bacteroidales bacterium]|nr:DUF4421 family protein [Candidatus Colimorpha onthohippi]